MLLIIFFNTVSKVYQSMVDWLIIILERLKHKKKIKKWQKL